MNDKTIALQHIMAVVEWKLGSFTQTFRFLILNPQSSCLLARLVKITRRIAVGFRSRIGRPQY